MEAAKVSSLAFLAFASASLFVLVFHGGEAADVTLQDILRPKRHVQIGGIRSCVSSLTGGNYVVTPNVGTYKIHCVGKTWNDARMACLADGGQLAVIDSGRKHDLFKMWKRERALLGLWLGFHDLFKEGTWVTVTGESMDSIGYNPWAPGEPNNGWTGQNCGILWDFGVDDYTCDSVQPFICEINLCESFVSSECDYSEE